MASRILLAFSGSPRSRRLTVVSAAGMAFVLLAPSCTGNSTSGTGNTSGTSNTSSASNAISAHNNGLSAPRISWRGCVGGKCGLLKVGLRPKDRVGQRGAKTINLALFRAVARNPLRRLGVLLINPGGPGGSGVDAARSLSQALPETIRDHFDIVGWDPRGTWRSTPVRCGDRLDYLFRADTAPDSNAERSELERVSKRFSKSCSALSGDLLAHVSSFDTVRDMDRIRTALGEKKINYLGYSYGTFIGALYAQKYPTHVRAMVLDGAVDASRPPETALIEQAQGLDRALNRFFRWCDKTPTCLLRTGGAGKRYESLRIAVDNKPIKRNKRFFGPTQFDLGVSSFLYLGEAGYGELAEGLNDLSLGDAALLLALSDVYVGRSASGYYDNSWAAFLAVSCLDGPTLGDEADLAEVAERARRSAPGFGPASVGLGYPCATWRAAPLRAEARPISAKGAPPIVVVGTRGDPITPLIWAEGLSAQLGNGNLVIAAGAQHTAFPSGDGCLDRFISRYLVGLHVPDDGASCPDAPIPKTSTPPII